MQRALDDMKDISAGLNRLTAISLLDFVSSYWEHVSVSFFDWLIYGPIRTQLKSHLFLYMMVIFSRLIIYSSCSYLNENSGSLGHSKQAVGRASFHDQVEFGFLQRDGAFDTTTPFPVILQSAWKHFSWISHQIQSSTYCNSTSHFLLTKLLFDIHRMVEERLSSTCTRSLLRKSTCNSSV
jgi:hypothetical protein